MSNPQIGLARAYMGLKYKDVPVVASRSGVKGRQVANLLGGRPVSADAFLRLALAIGHDPMPGFPKPDDGQLPADLDRVRFALGLRIVRGVNQHNERAAAEQMGLSAATVCRLENAHAMSIGVVIAACKYMNSHVFGWLKTGTNAVPVPLVSRETMNPPPALQGIFNDLRKKIGGLDARRLVEQHARQRGIS